MAITRTIPFSRASSIEAKPPFVVKSVGEVKLSVKVAASAVQYSKESPEKGPALPSITVGAWIVLPPCL